MRVEIASGHVRTVVARRLTEDRAAVVTAVLRTQGLHVSPEVDVFGVVHLWTKPTDTAGEIRVLRAFAAVTDSPLAYHETRQS